jgi:hypothetical protein
MVTKTVVLILGKVAVPMYEPQVEQAWLELQGVWQ